jgi:hypothetical protein
MNDIIKSLDTLGPVGILVGLGGGIVKWLLTDRAGLISALAQALERDRELRDRRADELTAHAKMLADSTAVIAEALDGVVQSINRIERAGNVK